MAHDHYARIPLKLIVRPYEDRYVAEISGVDIKAYDSSETGAVCCVLKGLHETIDREGFSTWSRRILSEMLVKKGSP